ncbi:hypothetical protein EV586_10946 [Tumebacillus sp. BK434]|nr:hypothetical protein EV586_10946 [Tumebacillus sp. BK434]
MVADVYWDSFGWYPNYYIMVQLESKENHKLFFNMIGKSEQFVRELYTTSIEEVSFDQVQELLP